MKKWLALFLILIMSVPMVAMAELPKYTGTWILLNQDSTLFELFVLTEDGHAYYCNASFKEGSDSFSRAFGGTWTRGIRGIHVVYGNTAEGNFYLNASGDLVSDLGITYTRIGNSAAAVPEGAVVLPQGVYEVGPDVPPGRYKISVDPEISYATVEIYRDEKDTYGKTYFLGTVYKSSEMNITLKEGMSIEMASCAVTLTPVE